jgi:hypothetical protein
VLVRNGRNRDTAWYAMIDGDWPAMKAAIESWLDSANFDTQGRQITPLSGFGISARELILRRDSS